MMHRFVLSLMLPLGLIACEVGVSQDGAETVDGDPIAAEYMEDFANPIDPARVPACRNEAFSMPEYRTCLDSVQVALEGQMAVLMALRRDSIQAYLDRGIQTSSYSADTIGWRATLEQGQDAFERYRRTQCGGEEALAEGQWNESAGWVTYETGAVNGSQPEVPECHIVVLRRRVAELENPALLRMPRWE